MASPAQRNRLSRAKVLQWKKTTVIRADQKKVPARAPVIISASRATDIPAFYSDWLIHRLEAGYAVWVNPFNRKPGYISFEAARLFVFWTKNPRPLMPRLDEFERRDTNYYFQFTLNDYESEKLEPRLPPLQERIRTFRELSDKIGRHRVIWRFDPLIVTPGLSVEHLLEKIASIGSRLMHKTDKLVVSFVDVAAYQKVQNSLIRELDCFDRASVFSAEPSESQIRQIARGLEQLKTRWYKQGWDITVATCGESMDLKTDYGIVKNKCIDDDLIRRVFSHDQKLMRFVDYGETDPDTVRQLEMFATSKKVDLKDKGQRKACGCISSKDIGMYDTCPHFCVYCYANTSRNKVNHHIARHSQYGEGLVDSPKSSQL
jgi:DNA repair photolyase